jgi:pimeloyl-ACP methyl ester carboxylesterase
MWNERKVRVGADEIVVREAGEGRPLLVLHDELGPTAWLGWHEAIARHRRLVMPVQPGARAERIGWIRNVRDLAFFYGQFLRDAKGGAVDVLGFSFGGWVAAEMAIANPAQFSKLALVAPFGIKPTEGFIMDMFPMSAADYVRASVVDADATAEFANLYGPPSPEQFEAFEDARTEVARLGWEPYMHDPSLDSLLPGLAGLPALVLGGDKDAILPVAALRAYERGIPDCRLKIFDACGHRPEIEKRDEFVKALVRFLD